MKYGTALACVATLAAFAVVACDKTEAEKVKAVQDLNLSKPLQFTVHTFSTPSTEGDTASNGQPATGMPSADTHYCVLTRVAGDFQGDGEAIRLSNEGGKWSLTGTAGSAGGVHAQATCVPKFMFQMTQVANVPMASASISPPAGTMAGSCNLQSTVVTGAVGKAFFVTGMKGRWSGGGEGISVSPTGADTAAARAKGCSGSAGGWAQSYLLRQDLKPIRYFSANGPTTDADAATFSFEKGTGPAEKWWEIFPGLEMMGSAPDLPVQMAPVDQAVCGIVAISGKFRGTGESITVHPQGGNWVLSITNGQQDNGYVNAAVRCVLRDQRG